MQAALLGTTTRTDGAKQVTYNGHPLYYFVNDKAAGDARGQGINRFGGGWYVVDPTGNKIDPDDLAAPAPAPAAPAAAATATEPGRTRPASGGTPVGFDHGGPARVPFEHRRAAAGRGRRHPHDQASATTIGAAASRSGAIVRAAIAVRANALRAAGSRAGGRSSR